MHEQIENEYIIGLLQQRSQTIYNVHSDNKLSEMLSLFEKGLKNVKVSCTNGYLSQLVPSSDMSLAKLVSVSQQMIPCFKKMTLVKDSKEDFFQGITAVEFCSQGERLG